MTEAEITAALRTLTPAQIRMMVAMKTDDWTHIGRGKWKTLDALLEKGLLIGMFVLNSRGAEVHRYYPPALVEEVFWRMRQAHDTHAPLP